MIILTWAGSMSVVLDVCGLAILGVASVPVLEAYDTARRAMSRERRDAGRTWAGNEVTVAPAPERPAVEAAA